GPQTYTRSTGQPTTVTNTFQVANAGAYRLVVASRDVVNAQITIDGQTILDANDFNRNNVPAASVTRPVSLRSGANQISVILRSQPGTSLTVQILGTDNVRPAIQVSETPAPNANGWNRTNVTATFACSDAGSGIASCPPPV